MPENYQTIPGQCDRAKKNSGSGNNWIVRITILTAFFFIPYSSGESILSASQDWEDQKKIVAKVNSYTDLSHYPPVLFSSIISDEEITAKVYAVLADTSKRPLSKR